MWKHTSHYVIFTLVMDNFRVKYTNSQYVEHLRNAQQILYLMTSDWKKSKKLRLALKLYYINRTVDFYIPN